MKFWRISLVTATALIFGWGAQDADAQAQAGTYTCATVTINASGQITAIAANECAHSGDCDRPFRPKVITDTGDRDHVVCRPEGRREGRGFSPPTRMQVA